MGAAVNGRINTERWSRLVRKQESQTSFLLCSFSSPARQMSRYISPAVLNTSQVCFLRLLTDTARHRPESGVSAEIELVFTCVKYPDYSTLTWSFVDSAAWGC